MINKLTAGGIIFFIIFIIFISSCNDETTGPVQNNDPVIGGYQNTESAQCMTLSTLAYVNENNTAYIKDSLIIQLSNTGYATGGKWVLDWGPGLSPDKANMMYVAKDTSTNPDSYCIAVRGTDWCFPFDWKQDLGAIDFVDYPYGNGTADSVSYGAIEGLNALLAMTDSVTGKTLAQYLNNFPSGTNRMYITGHSLGGQLATILSSWFLDNGYSSKFSLKAYTYAAPSVGNQNYVDHYTQIFSAANAESHRVINTNDLVPQFSANLVNVIVNQIPTTLPIEVDAVILGIQTYFVKYDLIYKDVGVKYELGTLTPTDCNYAPGSLDQYECWVAFEHHTTNYLKLLNAPVTNFTTVPCKWEQP
ncbi:MAG TPA: hypothetical protein PKD83_03130 [Ignavibacteria bacterium]|nr:hypothetical protein [Ignavibacteria bacterium]